MPRNNNAASNRVAKRFRQLERRGFVYTLGDKEESRPSLDAFVGQNRVITVGAVVGASTLGWQKILSHLEGPADS